MFKLIIKLISDLIGPVNLKKSLMKQIGPSVGYKHLFLTTYFNRDHWPLFCFVSFLFPLFHFLFPLFHTLIFIYSVFFKMQFVSPFLKVALHCIGLFCLSLCFILFSVAALICISVGFFY